MISHSHHVCRFGDHAKYPIVFLDTVDLQIAGGPALLMLGRVSPDLSFSGLFAD
jgi:hypothetical protein